MTLLRCLLALPVPRRPGARNAPMAHFVCAKRRSCERPARAPSVSPRPLPPTTLLTEPSEFHHYGRRAGEGGRGEGKACAGEMKKCGRASVSVQMAARFRHETQGGACLPQAGPVVFLNLNALVTWGLGGRGGRRIDRHVGRRAKRKSVVISSHSFAQGSSVVTHTRTHTPPPPPIILFPLTLTLTPAPRPRPATPRPVPEPARGTPAPPAPRTLRPRRLPRPGWPGVGRPPGGAGGQKGEREGGEGEAVG